MGEGTVLGPGREGKPKDTTPFQEKRVEVRLTLARFWMTRPESKNGIIKTKSVCQKGLLYGTARAIGMALLNGAIDVRGRSPLPRTRLARWFGAAFGEASGAGSREHLGVFRLERLVC